MCKLHFNATNDRLPREMTIILSIHSANNRVTATSELNINPVIKYCSNTNLVIQNPSVYLQIVPCTDYADAVSNDASAHIIHR